MDSAPIPAGRAPLLGRLGAPYPPHALRLVLRALLFWVGIRVLFAMLFAFLGIRSITVEASVFLAAVVTAAVWLDARRGSAFRQNLGEGPGWLLGIAFAVAAAMETVVQVLIYGAA